MSLVTSKARRNQKLYIYNVILLLRVFDFLKRNTYTYKNALPIKHTSLVDATETETHSLNRTFVTDLYFNVTVF